MILGISLLTGEYAQEDDDRPLYTCETREQYLYRVAFERVNSMRSKIEEAWLQNQACWFVSDIPETVRITTPERLKLPDDPGNPTES